MDHVFFDASGWLLLISTWKMENGKWEMGNGKLKLKLVNSDQNRVIES